MSNILVTICARGGSKGVKGKNIRPLMGKPLICHTIDQAKAWNKAKRVVVSTESEAIAQVAREWGMEIPFMRPAEYATDDSPKYPALRHALISAQKYYNERYDTIVDLDVTCPIRTNQDLDNCLEIYEQYKPKTLVSVVQSHKNPYFNMVEEKEGGRFALSKEPSTGYVVRRQIAPKVFSLNAAIYFYRSDYLLNEKVPSPFSDDTRVYVMEDIAGIDIDREIDFNFIEFLGKAGYFKFNQNGSYDYLQKFSLKGKVVFVCGGAGLIGSEVSKAVASAGARTIILDINKKGGEELAKYIRGNLGYDACFEYFDITKIKDLEKSLLKFSEKYGGLDGWVNSSYPHTQDWGDRVEDLKVDSMKKNVDIHLNSAIWSSRAIAMIMKDRNVQGSIINFGSTYGVQGNDFTVYEGTDMTSPMAYSAIKGGIINLTRYLASYFGANKIRINNLCPGGIEGEGQNDTFKRNYSKKTPLKRMGTPEDVASATIFLLSDASSYITGATLMVDGGWTAV